MSHPNRVNLRLIERLTTRKLEWRGEGDAMRKIRRTREQEDESEEEGQEGGKRTA